MNLKKSCFTQEKHGITWNMSLTHKNQQHFKMLKDLFKEIVRYDI